MRLPILAGFVTLFAIGATVGVWHLHGAPRFGIDDANIFFGYAENLVAGKGITYANTGERVEGFSSMLWMLMCAVMFALDWDEQGVLALSVLMLVMTHLLLAAAAGRGALEAGRVSGWFQASYLMLALTSPAHVTWMTITLMDTGLWGLMVAIMTTTALWPPRSQGMRLAGGTAFALAPLARPEGMLVAPVILWMLWLRSDRKLPQTRFCLLTFSAMAAVTGVATGFRLAYFGHPLPNTFYAKVSPLLSYNLETGLHYLGAFALSGVVITAGICIAVMASGLRLWKATARLFRNGNGGGEGRHPNQQTNVSEACGIICLVLLAVPVLTGGDHFALFRFYQPVCPILILGLCLGFVGATKRLAMRSRLGGLVITGVAAVLGTVGHKPAWWGMIEKPPLRAEFQLAEAGLEHGRALGELFPKSKRLPRIGILMAGGFARTYPGPVLDLLGLNNPQMARSKGDRRGMKNHAAFAKEVFYQQEPDILLAMPAVHPATESRDNLWLEGLLDAPEFAARWRYGVLRLRDLPERSQPAFYRRAYLDNIRPEEGLEFIETLRWNGEGWERTP